jgi:hypothetical protein
MIAVLAGMEDYFYDINTVTTNDQRRRIGERYLICVIHG